MQMKEQKLTITDSIKCSILQQMILQKMFAEQADRDSLIVSDEEVESKLENRIRYFVNMYGSKEKLEEALGKTTYQLKDENRDLIKEQMMAERMQGKVMGNISVTPSEVRAFFNQIPKDSLPFFPATVELGQIIIAPYTSKELDQYAKEKLSGIRNQIVNEGKTVYGINTGFGILANTAISKEDTVTLQHKILQSHSVGGGDAIPTEIAKLMLITKVQSLSQGFSGVQLTTLERIIWHIDHDVIPVVPEKGSVGASGDLAPLSHLFLPLIGQNVVS